MTNSKEQLEGIKEEIKSINGYKKSGEKKVDLELITTEEARGLVFLGTLFETIKMVSDGTSIGFVDTLVYGKLYEKLADKIAELKAEGKTPNAFSLDYLNTYSYSNCIEHYTYVANFYGESK